MTSDAVDSADFYLVVGSARYAPSAGNRKLQVVIPVSDHRLLSPVIG